MGELTLTILSAHGTVLRAGYAIMLAYVMPLTERSSCCPGRARNQASSPLPVHRTAESPTLPRLKCPATFVAASSLVLIWQYLHPSKRASRSAPSECMVTTCTV